MKPLNVYWHIYRRHQIKPEFRGNLVYLLEIPPLLGAPVIRHVFDPRAVDFPVSPRHRFTVLVKDRHHGIIYDGVSKLAISEFRAHDPKINRADPRFALYNRQIVCQSREFFLTDPEEGFDHLPEHTLRLLCGQNVLLSKLYARPVPAIS
jgi:hypothetical protein